MREILLQMVDLRATSNMISSAVDTIHTNVVNVTSVVDAVKRIVQTDQNLDFDVEQNAPVDSGDFSFDVKKEKTKERNKERKKETKKERKKEIKKERKKEKRPS